MISATASESLDLNFDGVASFNLKNELPDMSDFNLDINININQFSGTNALCEYWPEPYFGFLGEVLPKHYDPNIPIYYARQGVARSFEFSKDLKSILLYPENSTTNLQRFPRPDSILIQPGDIIEVAKRKEFYTTSDWKKVELIILYKRKYVY